MLCARWHLVRARHWLGEMRMRQFALLKQCRSQRTHSSPKQNLKEICWKMKRQMPVDNNNHHFHVYMAYSIFFRCFGLTNLLTDKLEASVKSEDRLPAGKKPGGNMASHRRGFGGSKSIIIRIPYQQSGSYGACTLNLELMLSGYPVNMSCHGDCETKETYADSKYKAWIRHSSNFGKPKQARNWTKFGSKVTICQS